MQPKNEPNPETLPTPKHFNGNVMAAVDIETTGLQAGHHEIVQIAVVILDDKFRMNKSVLPFYTDLQPLHVDRIDPIAMRVNKLKLVDLLGNGLHPWKAAETFAAWVGKLNLAEGKKIIPLGHNYPFDMSFLREWLGNETYESLFHYAFRDSKVVAEFLNDKSWWTATEHPYPKTNLQYVATKLGITDVGRAHDALSDALKAAEVYRRLLSAPPV